MIFFVIALNYDCDNNKQNPLSWFYFLLFTQAAAVSPLKKKERERRKDKTAEI